MKLIDAAKQLKTLGQPILQTSDVAARLGVPRANASKVMTRLAESGFALQLTRGRWVLTEDMDRLLIPEFLAAPFPSYVSLQTALFHQGFISQIPEVIYAVTAGRTRRYETRIGTYSLHHIDPEFFFGFEAVGPHHIKMATPEKALLDFLYLSPARSGLFQALPEVELPRRLNKKLALKMAKQIHSASRRTMVVRKLGELF